MIEGIDRVSETLTEPAQALARLLDPADDDPHPSYAALREAGDGVHWADAMQGYFVTRYDDVKGMCRDTSLFSSDHFWISPAAGHDPGDPRQAASVDVASRQFMFSDPPVHTRLRRILSPFFTTPAIPRWRVLVERIVDERLGRLEPGQEVDFIAEIAALVPVAVIAGILGVPIDTDADLAQWRVWSRDMGATLDISISGAEQERAVLGQGALIDALAETLRLRRGDPRDDLISAVAHLTDDDGAPVDDRDTLAQLMLLFAAGVDTTAGLLGNGLELLLRDPEETARIAAAGGMAAAVEEALRFEPPVHFDLRVTTRPVVIGRTRIDAGQAVYQILPAANRDPRVFTDPDTFRPGRPNAARHLSFLHGPHHCIGAMLARLEGEVVFSRVLRTFPGIHLAGTPRRRTRDKATRSLTLLPVRL